MKLFEHPIYGKKIPWLCRLHLHFFYSSGNGPLFPITFICSRCGWVER